MQYNSPHSHSSSSSSSTPTTGLQQQQQQQHNLIQHQQQQQQQQQVPLIPISQVNIPQHHLPTQEHDKDSTKQVVNIARRGPWAPDEDNRLLDLILLFGASNWVRISQTLGTRTPKQCRERYHQNLKPSLNRTPITQEEGELIEQLVATCGKKWAEIARHLNGRSDNAVKNWWNGGANRRRRASAQLETKDVKNNDIAFNTGIFTDQQQLPPLPPSHLQQQQLPLHPLPPQRSISFDFRYPQQQQQQAPQQQQQQQDHYHLSRKQRKLIDEPISRRHSLVYIGSTSSPLSHPPSISSRNSSLSHEYTGITTSYNSSDNESVSRRSSIFANPEQQQQHRKTHSNHLSPSFQPLSRLSISSNNGISLPPLSPTTFPNSRQNSIHSERLPPLNLSNNSSTQLNIPQPNIPNNNNTFQNNVFKREFSFSKLDTTKSLEPAIHEHPLKKQFQVESSNTSTATTTTTTDSKKKDNKDDEDKRRMSIANLLG